MNPAEWLRRARENGQKGLIPPVPPEGAPVEKDQKAQKPPETPCDCLYLFRNGNLGADRVVQAEMHWREGVCEVSGGHRGNEAIYRGNEGLAHRVDGGNQAKSKVSNPAEGLN